MGEVELGGLIELGGVDFLQFAHELEADGCGQQEGDAFAHGSGRYRGELVVLGDDLGEGPFQVDFPPQGGVRRVVELRCGWVDGHG